MQEKKCVFLFSTVKLSVDPPIISSQDFEWKCAVRQFRPQIDRLLCLSGLFPPVFKSLPKPHHWPPHVTVLWLLWGTDRQDGVDMGPLWQCGLPGCLERWLAVLEWLAVPSLKRTSTWWASRVVPHSHCRLDSGAVMRSSSGCSSGTGSHLQAVYNYPLFLFSWERYLQSSKLVGQQPRHLTCVGAEPLPVLPAQCLLGSRSIWTPFVVMGGPTPGRVTGMSWGMPAC